MARGAPDVGRYLDKHGRLRLLPKRPHAKNAALLWLIEKFEQGRDYNEREVNEVIQDAHAFMDHTRVRRELIDAGLMERERDGSRYWRARQPS